MLHGPFYQFAGIGKGWRMEPKKPLNQFQEVREKVQERLDRAHKLKEKDGVLH